MTSTPAQFAVKMQRTADGMSQASRQITTRAAQTVKLSVQRKLAVAAPRGRLNVGKRGQRIGVRYDLLTDTEAVVRMTGPAHLIERDTKAHRIPRERRTARARKRVVVVPGVGVRAYANHPGTKGKHPFEEGVEAGQRDLDKVAGRVYFGVLRKGLK